MNEITIAAEYEAWVAERTPRPLGPLIEFVIDRLTWRLTDFRAFTCPRCPNQWIVTAFGATHAYCASHPLWGDHAGEILTMVAVPVAEIDPIKLVTLTGLSEALART